MKRIRKLKRKKNAKYCECGCGQEVKMGNRFILGHARCGKKTSNKTKKKLSIAALNMSDETKRKIGLAARSISDETRKKMSLTHTGMKHTDEAKKKMSIINKGKKLSEEHKRKISLTKQNMSNETKKKISEAGIGRIVSDETKLKISIGMMKCRTDGYCDAWSDNDYKNECRKSYCENCGRKKVDGYLLVLHHINLDKKDCRPINLMTLCRSCHLFFHQKLCNINKRKTIYQETFIILTGKDRVKYIHKETKKEITIIRKFFSFKVNEERLNLENLLIERRI